MFGKLLKKGGATTNLGNKSGNLPESDNTTIATYITVSGIADGPSEQLEKKLTVGSEIGDILITEGDIAPRHCTFFLNQGVVSVMDHSSPSGTFINKKKIDPGKIFILSEKDKIKLGKIDITVEYLSIPTEEDLYSEDHFDDSEHFEEEELDEIEDIEDDGDVEVQDGKLNLSEDSINTQADTSEDETVTNVYNPNITQEIPTLEVEVNDVVEEDAPEFQTMTLNDTSFKQDNLELAGNEAPEVEAPVDQDIEGEDYSEDAADDDVDIEGVDVEEEELDINILPIEIRAEHDELEKKRQEQEAKEEESATILAVKEGEEPPQEMNEDLLLDLEPDAATKTAMASRNKTKKNKVAAKGKKNKNKGKAKSKPKVTADPSSSFLTRLFASLNDTIICLIILELFLIYKDFETMYKDVPKDIWNAIKPHYDQLILPHYKTLEAAVPEFNTILTEIQKLENLDNIISFVFLFFFMRILFGFIFSVSLGQLLIGMRVPGKFLWKRFAYPLREILGVLTFPFLIFDAPTLFKRRSLKEILTFTQYRTPVKSLSLLSGVVVTPFLILVLCFAPIFKGFELKDTINVVNEKKSSRKHEYKKPTYIKSINLTLDQSDRYVFLPTFNLVTKKKKRILKTGVLVLDTNENLYMKIYLEKKFNLMDMYSSFVKLNLASQYFQPQMYSIVNDASRKNKNYKFKINNPKALSEETLNLVEDVYSFGFTNLFPFILRNGILMSGFRDFREKFDNIFDSTPDVITRHKKFGSHPGVVANLGSGPNAYYNFIPFGSTQGYRYKIEGRIKSKNSKAMISSFHWNEIPAKQIGEVKLVKNDLIGKYIDAANSGKEIVNKATNTEIYNRYFNAIKKYLKDGRVQPQMLLEKEITQFINVLETNKKKNRELSQKLSQLLQALKDKKFEFFNLEVNLNLQKKQTEIKEK